MLAAWVDELVLKPTLIIAKAPCSSAFQSLLIAACHEVPYSDKVKTKRKSDCNIAARAQVSTEARGRASASTGLYTQ